MEQKYEGLLYFAEHARQMDAIEKAIRNRREPYDGGEEIRSAERENESAVRESAHRYDEQNY